MNAMDKMRMAMGGTQKDAPQVIGQKQPSGMEAVMLRMLEGVGLDAKALSKMQSDVANYASFCADNLSAIRKQNDAILSNQASILAALAELNDNDRRNCND